MVCQHCLPDSKYCVSRMTGVMLACAVALALLLGSAFASERVSGRRAALVIGNSGYQHLAALPNAVNDADRAGQILERANFEVTLGRNLDKKGLEETILGFLRTLNDGDVALFYYSGHAVQVAGHNYILPIDASLATSYDLEVEAYNVSSLLEYMRETSSLQIAILDACRDNPFANNAYFVGQKKIAVDGKKGLASVTPQDGALIVYSTSPDQVALDGNNGLSPFTGAFADYALKPNVEIRKLLGDIRAEVIKRTDGRQTPWDASSLTSSFFFVTRQNLLIIEDMREVRVPPKAASVDLRISPPITSGDTPLSISFTKLPETGTLWLGDKQLDLDSKIAADQVATVKLKPGAGGIADEEIRYAVTTEGGRTASGIVKVVVDANAVVAAAIKPALTIQQGDDAQQAPAPKPILVAMASDVGTGFAALPEEVVRSANAPKGWLRLESRDPQTQVAVGDQVVSEGDLIKSEDIAKLRIRPSLTVVADTSLPELKPIAEALKPANEPAQQGAAAPGKIASDTPKPQTEPAAKAEPVQPTLTRTVVLVPAVKTEMPAPITINVAVSVNDCDTLAAEPLDVQAVSGGRLPNDIDVPKALAACKTAVDQHPDVARFKYQYARALYANGEFDAALKELSQSSDAGHVRASYLLGRLYQFGAAVARDPARSIPLYETGAKRGDPYSQYALGKALVGGLGTKPDIGRGMALVTSAAESGHTYAMNMLGAEYLSGEHVKKDEQRALRFFKESADRDDIYGQVFMGIMYRDGVGVEKDSAKATDLFEKARTRGHPYAGRLLGRLALKDKSADTSTVVGWYRESAERGDAWGAYFAAELIKDNPKLQRDEGELARLYALAASYQFKDVSDQARKALGGVSSTVVGKEIQKTLARMGHDIGDVDGKIGGKTLDAAETVLGTSAPRDARSLLMQLLHKEWIDSRPRLDLLG